MALMGMKGSPLSQGHCETQTGDLGVIWGADAIGKTIGLTKRQAFYLLENGRLRGATKIGGRWCITARALAANVDPTAEQGITHWDGDVRAAIHRLVSMVLETVELCDSKGWEVITPDDVLAQVGQWLAILPERCPGCGSVPMYYYVIRDDLWAVVNRSDAQLCIPCVEERLGRPLARADFTDCPANDPDFGFKSNRLLNILKGREGG